MVDNGTFLYHSSVKILGNTITNSLVKGSVGKIFIAGDTIEELGKTIKNLNE